MQLAKAVLCMLCLGDVSEGVSLALLCCFYWFQNFQRALTALLDVSFLLFPLFNLSLPFLCSFWGAGDGSQGSDIQA